MLGAGQGLVDVWVPDLVEAEDPFPLAVPPSHLEVGPSLQAGVHANSLVRQRTHWHQVDRASDRSGSEKWLVLAETQPEMLVLE